MKIVGPGQIQSKSVQKTSRKQSSDGAGFTNALSSDNDTSASANVSGAVPLTTMDALLSLQEAPDATDGRSKGLQRANDMLDLLEDVRKGLLLGAIPVQNLRTLSSLAREQKNNQQDPRLNEILAEIELRAEVELAKFGV